MALKNFILNPQAMAMVSGSSKGTQPKYYENGYWYKVNNIGYEGLAERLCSMVLRYSNVNDYVEYEQCMINGRKGCRSKNFLAAGDSFLSFARLYNMFYGGELLDAVRQKNTVEERIEFVIDFVRECTDGLDCSRYLSQILSFDMLILNTDRHFNNLGIIASMETNTYRTAPIFDNGNSLLSDFGEFDFDTPLEENIEKVVGKPFSVNLYTQASAVGIGLKLDYDAIEAELQNEPASRALSVLRYQLNYYKDLLDIKV